MKTFRSKSGPFAEQPFYEAADIESICTEELQRVQLYPSEPSPIRIDRFLEKRFGVQPTYEDLPKGLHGFTLFGPKGVEEIVVAKTLDEEGTIHAERRLRSTLAHEGGHGLLHAHLFAFGERPESLFGDGLDADAPKILCRGDGVAGTETAGKKAAYRWWEYQADLVMGTILLPKALVEKAITPMLASEGIFRIPALPEGQRERAIQLLVETFNINRPVARIRLERLYPVSASGQLTL